MSVRQSWSKVNSTNAFRRTAQHKNPEDLDRSQKTFIILNPSLEIQRNLFCKPKKGLEKNTNKKSMKTLTITILLGFFALISTASAEKQKKGKKDIVDTAVAAGSFKTLAAALGAADLVETMKGKGPFTVFAPTDEAFAKLPEGTVETLLKPENKDKLVSILTYHVVSGKVRSKKAVTLSKATALNKKDIALAVKGESLTLNGTAKVVKADIMCSNGVIHVIDNVILPPSK